MSSKPSNSNTDNHYNMTRSLTSPIPLDNELSSIKQSYKENGLIDEQIYSVISNRDDCDNARNANEGVAELGDDKASNTKENMFTPRGGRKFSPDKIKGILIYYIIIFYEHILYKCNIDMKQYIDHKL